MSEPTSPEPVIEARPTALRRYRISAAIVIALALGLVAWLVVRDNGDATSSPTPEATAVSAEQLQALAASVGHPVYWAGPRAGSTYELVRAAEGSIYIRYLPQGAEVGTRTPYLTVATYPFADAYAAIRSVTKEAGTTAITLANGGLAESSPETPTSVHAAYPGVDYQVEVFDPAPGAAAALVSAGQLAALGTSGGTTTAATAPAAASPGRLQAVAASLGHPIYWAGPKQGYTYELEQKADGQVIVRYLPPGTEVGAAGQYLTVGTYPYRNALGAIRKLANEQNAVVIELPAGGLAVVDGDNGKNIHLAYPGSDYQVEVFDPSAAEARQVVASGRLESIG